MARGINKAILFGNVGRDPELKVISNGASHLVNFGLATSESRKVGDEWKEETTWHNIVAFGKQAERIAERVHKGDKLFIEGMISNRSYEQNGEKKYRSEVIVQSYTVVANDDGGVFAVEEGEHPIF